ncbi:MAG: DeoR/GlpR family DNA-binding transcription regulator [Spirochaetales bacterium]|uniref:DeoR/GlpR family DNA-binding transcription regulator n=1 Tax=Candidatus Thalassospirochaeta sargassi TaxID=3119039 RepID=A0AAJ1IIB8_9SPIO|nr:DeoR/GlpR family DNA-binding transcription regulator [Spirochaetales bacterium]
MSEREKKILDILSDDTTVSIQKISEKLSVSQVTIRSDLNAMEGKGIILRLRGGALPAFHPDVLERQKTNISAKKKIARAAAAMVGDGDTIMISDGTSSSLIPKYLLGKRDVRLVTNSTLILPYARVNPSLHTTLVGGDFKAGTEAIVGAQALAQLENYYVKYVFVGTGGFSVEKGLTSHLQEGAEIVRKMTELGDTVVMTADSSKYNLNGFVKILPLDKIDILITDDGLDSNIQKQISSLGIKLIVV